MTNEPFAGEATMPSQPAARRRTVAALARVMAPAGVLYLDGASVSHPEAARLARLPFVFAIGRVPDGARHRTARELRMVIDAALPDGAAIELVALDAALTAYARAVVHHVPTMAARLSGRFLASQPAVAV